MTPRFAMRGPTARAASLAAPTFAAASRSFRRIYGEAAWVIDPGPIALDDGSLARIVASAASGSSLVLTSESGDR
ncbi:MAG: hypothetical protein DRH08_00070 [Deltaproteobacteria bacterium]|nr:MAG: hypothetical protein DRH08_00070 [Deltaproteobacteria bacterium]